MDKKKFATFLYYFLIISVLSFLVYAVYFMQSESRQCVKQPFFYGAQKLGNLECNCILPINMFCREEIFFNGSVFISDVNSECKARNDNPVIPEMNISFR